MTEENFQTSIGIRLKTEEILTKIEGFLKGQNIETDYIIDENTGQLKAIKNIIEVGRPLLNDKGVQHIMTKMHSYINTQTVQGNFKKDTVLDNLTYNFQINTAYDLMLHLYKFELDENDFEFIVDTLTDFVFTFLTRTLDNKERESLIQTVRQVDTTHIHENTREKGFNLPKMGSG